MPLPKDLFENTIIHSNSLSMKKLILFPLFYLIAIFGLRAQAGSFTLCPNTDPAETCGCTGGCVTAGLCSPAGTGNCNNNTLGTATVSVPAGQTVTVDITQPTCTSFSNLDAGESYSVGSTTVTSTGSGTPPFTGCLATGGTTGTFDITVLTNRKDECLEVNVIFTANGGTPPPTCEELSAALPVELISFDGKIKDDVINLSWKTASELDNDYFQIEHSTNGIVFFPVGNIVGNGTTFEEQSYQFNHNHPVDGSNFYRLKQVDFDGKFEYSRSLSVDFKKADFWRLFPTQSNDGITIDWSNNFSAEAISIFNINGKMVHFEKIDTDAQQKYISIENFPSGSYFLKMQSGRSISTKRFFKLK